MAQLILYLAEFLEGACAVQIKVTEQYNIMHIAIIATCIIQCMTMAIVRTDYDYDCVILLTMQLWL